MLSMMEGVATPSRLSGSADMLSDGDTAKMWYAGEKPELLRAVSDIFPFYAARSSRAHDCDVGRVLAFGNGYA